MVRRIWTTSKKNNNINKKINIYIYIYINRVMEITFGNFLILRKNKLFKIKFRK